MDVILQLQKGQKSFGPKTLFDQATFAVNTGEHVGVIGPNGAGKTTLFKCLMDPDLLDGGQVIFTRGVKVGYLKQEDTTGLEQTILDYLLSRTDKQDWWLQKLGEGLGLDAVDWDMPLQSLSGGFQMRVKLLSLLSQDCDLLLLDEPTNYLDLESILVLERFLQDFTGAFLLISHDREFLRRTTDHILEVELGETTKFNGSIDDYFEQKQQLRELLEKKKLNQEAKQAEIMAFANRFRAKATKARQVQSKLKRLNKMEKIEVKGLPITAKIPIPSPVRTGKQALELQGVDMGYESKKILSDVQLTIQRGDHVGVVGVNGAGKSTLLKSISEQIPTLGGTIQRGLNVEIGYFAQHVSQHLDPKSTVYESMIAAAHPDILPQQVKDLAGGLLFVDDDINKPISVLSGGEKSRVALGQILLKRTPILVLDEPTNHLDFHTVEALTQALQTFDGTLIVVSHDRGFIARVASKIIEIRNGRAELYPGSYDEYLWSLEKGAWSDKATNTENNSSSTNPTKASSSSSINYKDLKKQIRVQRQAIGKWDSEMQKLTQQIEQHTEQLLKEQGKKASDLATELSQLKDQLSQAEEAWMESQEQLEQLESQLS